MHMQLHDLVAERGDVELVAGRRAHGRASLGTRISQGKFASFASGARDSTKSPTGTVSCANCGWSDRVVSMTVA
jgi:hypothetical protein